MQANGLDERSLRDGRYDGILHLVTAACGAEEHYSLENNEVRSESAEVARDVRARRYFFLVSCALCGSAHAHVVSGGESCSVPPAVSWWLHLCWRVSLPGYTCIGAASFFPALRSTPGVIFPHNPAFSMACGRVGIHRGFNHCH